MVVPPIMEIADADWWAKIKPMAVREALMHCEVGALRAVTRQPSGPGGRLAIPEHEGVYESYQLHRDGKLFAGSNDVAVAAPPPGSEDECNTVGCQCSSSRTTPHACIAYVPWPPDPCANIINSFWWSLNLRLPR